MRGKLLAKQKNIYTFDEAKAQSRSRRASRDASKRSSSARNATSSRSSNARGGSSRRGFDGMEALERDSGARRSNRVSGDYARLRMPSSRDRVRSARSYEDSWQGFDSLDSSRGVDGFNSYDGFDSFDSYDDFAMYEDEAPVRPEKDNKASKRERKRKERTKARADRMFSKQFESDQAAEAPAEDAPRAALYEGQMGSSQRKSARMQRAATAAPQRAKIDPQGWLSNLNVSPGLLKIGTAILCIVLVGVFLYTPAQQYYQAQRDRDRLAAEYAGLEQRNEALDTQNSSLSSNAGMEDAVRQKYGYVVTGDQAAIVAGLSDVTTDTSRDSDALEVNVLSSAVKAPEEWYTPYLDAFFGVS